MKTAEKLYKVLLGFVAMNISFEAIHGEPDEATLKARAANHGLIRQAVIAGDFITSRGLDKEYRKFEKEVDKEVAKIAIRSKE